MSAAPRLVADRWEPEPEASPADVARAQTDHALDLLYADPELRVRFPYGGVDRMVGPLNPGRVVFVTAATGQGKTTFLLDLFDRWSEAGYRIRYEGTEQEAAELRIKWAALRCGVPTAIAINNGWGEIENGVLLQKRVAAELLAIGTQFAESVAFSDERFVTLRSVERACEQAADAGCHALVIDHIDRIDVGDADTEYRGTKRLVRRITELARDCGLLLLVASQLNREARRGDRLAAYYPPQLHHMRGGGSKEEEASVVLGIWRPVREILPGEDPKVYAGLLRAARAGEIAPREVLESNTMGVGLLKHRTPPDGVTEGDRCKLRLDRGRLHDVPERDRYVTAPSARGPRP